MAWDDYGYGVVGYCIAYGLGGHLRDVVFGGYCFGEGAVGGGLSVGDIA